MERFGQIEGSLVAAFKQFHLGYLRPPLSFCKDQYLKNPKLLLYHAAAVAAVSGYKGLEYQSQYQVGVERSTSTERVMQK